MQCSRCSRVVHAGRSACLYCGGAPVANPVPATAAGLEALVCPGCRATMQARDEGGVWIDTCGGCGGTWYDRGELEALLTRPENVAAGSEPGAAPHAGRTGGTVAGFGQKACPRCQDRLLERNYGRVSGVLVDVCAKDGVFVERGESERLRRFLAEDPAARAARAARLDAPLPLGRAPVSGSGFVEDLALGIVIASLWD